VSCLFTQVSFRKATALAEIYSKSSDEIERKAVRILDELMSRESGEEVEVGEKGCRE